MKKRNEINIENNSDVITLPKIKNPWKITTVILLIISLFLLISNGSFTLGASGEMASEKLVNYLNEKVGGGVEYLSHKDLGNLYEITVKYEGELIPLYITKDGKYFVQGAIPLDNSQPTPTPNPSKDVDADDDAVLGDPNAPITIIEFSDYECPYCKKFYLEAYPQLKKEYIETGKVKLIFRDFPLGFHQNAQKAAEAAECAGEQNKYYEMHDKLFENQKALSVSNLKDYAKQIGLDTTLFNSCLDSGQMEDEVKNDFNDGQSYGVSGTPAFYINGKQLVGAQPFEAFKNIIEQELSN